MKDFKGLQYFTLYAVLLMGIFTYSGMTGWRWFHSQKTEKQRTTTHRYIRGGVGGFYHK